jgi:acyl-CoA hydrolase
LLFNKCVQLKIKSIASSNVIKTEIVCPNDANPMGILQGGKLVQWMDIAAAVCAQTHAECICVTASINEISFKQSAKVGDIITINAKITRAFKTSMEIKVEAFSKGIVENKKQLISKSYFIFVVKNDTEKPISIAQIKPKTLQEIQDFNDALKRKKKFTK